MIDSQTIGGMLMSGLVFWAGGRALADSSSPYEQIAQRNAFGLRMPVAETHTPPPEPLPKLKLVGIITRQTEKWVLLRMQAVLAAGTYASEQSLTLAQGERTGSIEVLEVDQTAACVKLVVSGKPMTLGFTQEGPASTAGPNPGEVAAGSTAPMPRGPGAGQRPPNFPPAAQSLSEEQQAAMYLLQKQANPKISYPPLPGLDESQLQP